MKVAVVTGGSDGIGKALALELAAQGLKVYIGGRDQKKLLSVQKNYPQLIHIVEADIALEDQRKFFVKQLASEEKIDFLVHNAGTEKPVRAFPDITLEEWHHSFAVNTEAPLFLTQMLLNKLPKGSRVLMISTGLAHYPLPGMLAYCASKAALYMIYQGLNTELNARGILVGSVTPGIVDTEMQTRLRENQAVNFPSVEIFKQFKKKEQLRAPEEVAKELAEILLTTSDKKFSSKEWDL